MPSDECVTCAVCGDCTHEAGHRRCESCETNRCDVCRDCEQCAACGHFDECVNYGTSRGRDSTSPFVRRELRLWPDTSRARGVIPRRMVGCEIEVAGRRKPANGIPKVAAKWGASVVQDGSLPSTGFEINTAPSSGEHFTLQLREWSDVLRQEEAYVEDSCGLHVHVDTRDMRYDDLMKTLFVYSRMENNLYSIIAPSRSDNTYCMKIGQQLGEVVSSYLSHKSHKKYMERHKIPMWKHRLYTELYGNRNTWRDVKHLKGYHRNQRRYMGLNVHSHFFRGTLEFRMHHGTTQFNKIRNWSAVCSSIVTVAKSKPWEWLKERFTYAGPEMFAHLPIDVQARQWVQERWMKFNAGETLRFPEEAARRADPAGEV